MVAPDVIQKAEFSGVRVWVEGSSLCYAPKSAAPPELVEELREHKAKVMAYLASPKVVDAPPQWHAEEIKRRVERDGLCVFWSDLFGEPVAFIANEGFREQMPAGVVCYTVKELELLFGDREAKPSDSALKLIHQGKKHGGRVIEHEGPKNGDD